MKKQFAALLQELGEGRGAVLCSIVASRGSTPREAGAKMLVLEDGSTVGTIGGGTVEHEAALRARDLLREGRSEERTYSLAPNGEAGMLCGGEVDLRFQYLSPSDARNPAALAREWETAERVVLFGGGHVARALVKVAAQADFSVEVWDERPEVLAPEWFPDAAALRCGPYEGALEAMPPVTPADYAVVMTHCHQKDFEVLAQVLRTPARYIGCIGSRSKAAAVREQLLAAGFAEEDVERIRSPIGLPIGGKSPGEIAVSVAAEMIACRSGRL